VADPISMPLTVARDLGGDEPVPDLAATARIVPTLSSPIADRWATWAKHVTLVATIGRSHWVLLEPEDMPPSLRTGWPVGLAGGWVVVSPIRSRRAEGHDGHADLGRWPHGDRRLVAHLDRAEVGAPAQR
jgi:hypothetical protein